jgi:hypothetical protein
MRGEKKRKISLKKRIKAAKEYNSDSESDSVVKKMTSKDMKELDLLGDEDFSDNLSLDLSELENDDDQVQEISKKKKNDKSTQEIEEGKTSKLASVISKILDSTADSKVLEKIKLATSSVFKKKN